MIVLNLILIYSEVFMGYGVWASFAPLGSLWPGEVVTSFNIVGESGKIGPHVCPTNKMCV